jgi:hypothetical protein
MAPQGRLEIHALRLTAQYGTRHIVSGNRAGVKYWSEMANPEHLAILKKGVAEWNEWRRKGHPDIRPEYQKAFERLLRDLNAEQCTR